MKTGFEEIIDDIQRELADIEVQLEHADAEIAEILGEERKRYINELSRAQQAHEDCADAERQGL